MLDAWDIFSAKTRMPCRYTACQKIHTATYAVLIYAPFGRLVQRNYVSSGLIRESCDFRRLCTVPEFLRLHHLEWETAGIEAQGGGDRGATIRGKR